MPSPQKGASESIALSDSFGNSQRLEGGPLRRALHQLAFRILLSKTVTSEDVVTATSLLRIFGVMIYYRITTSEFERSLLTKLSKKLLIFFSEVPFDLDEYKVQKLTFQSEISSFREKFRINLPNLENTAPAASLKHRVPYEAVEMALCFAALLDVHNSLLSFSPLYLPPFSSSFPPLLLLLPTPASPPFNFFRSTPPLLGTT